jgi:hypothetical protein
MVDETNSYSAAQPRILDRRAFRLVVNEISTYALELVAPEWEAVKQDVQQQPNLMAVDYPSCDCQVLLRWSLPCRHYLLQACITGEPIPRSLFHPRWWLHGGPITISDWRPLYQVQRIEHLNEPRWNDLTSSGLAVLTARDMLTNPLARAQYDHEVLRRNRELLTTAQALQARSIPTLLPDKVEKSKWLKPKKDHDSTTARSLTGTEIAEKLADKAEAEVVPATPPRALGHKRTLTLVDRTPEKPRQAPERRQARALSPPPQAAPTVGNLPPASTAPATVAAGESRAGRKRKERDYKALDSVGIDSQR